jgi:hypothetical protein
MKYILLWISVALGALLCWAPLAQATTPDQMPANSWLSIPNTKMSAVAPTNGQFPGIWGAAGPRAVISAWGGGALDTKRNRLVLWGGGHNDYYGNELYTFDIGILKWTRLTDPFVNPMPDTEQNADGTPTSRHTYAGLAYITHADRFFGVGGALAGSGLGSSGTWTFDFSTRTWTRQQNSPSAGNPCAAYDPATRRTWMAASQSGGLWSFNYDTKTWTKHNSDTWKLYRTCAIDTKRGLLFVVGMEKGGNNVYVYDIRNQTNPVRQTWTTTGGTDFLYWGQMGLDYDPVADRIVGWNGGVVYALNPDTKVWTAYNAPGAPTKTPNGIYGRWRYVPSVNAFILVTAWDQDVHFFKLTPGAGGALPSPAPSGDTISPTISFTAPANGATVSGTARAGYCFQGV